MKGRPMLRKENFGAARWPFTGTSFAPTTSERTARKRRQQADEHDRLEGGFGQGQCIFLRQPHDQHGDEDPHHRSGGIHGAVKAKGQAAGFFRHRIGHQRIPRRGADAFPDPVGPAHPGDQLPAAGKIEEGLGHRRKPIPSYRQPFAPAQFIRKPARKQL